MVSQLRLTQITVYPIKAAAGVSMDSWDVGHLGLTHDRRWMVVDPDGNLVTQREHATLALVQASIGPDYLAVEAPGSPGLTLPLVCAGPVVRVRVWDDYCDAIDCGPEVARWFTEYLAAPRRLVYMPSSTVRPADPDYDPAGTPVSFADAFPFLMLSEESLSDLNARLTRPIPMNRFRPNLVITGADPFVEDRLTDFEIGPIRFRAVKPCDRCVVTTIDQVTLERGVEPLRTLATYRRVGTKVMFGQNVVHRGIGRLSVGAQLLV